MTNSISFENTGSTVENMGQVVGYKLSLEEYKKFVINFEPHIAEIWSNNRKMKQKLLKEINEDDNNEFFNLESRYKSSTSFTSGSKFSYFGELVFEILDFLFPQFCADAFSITNDQDTNNTDCILKYLAHQNFKGHLGFLQHWYRSRLNDEKGQHFSKIQELRNPSTKHCCEKCIFSDQCTHECSYKLLSYNFHQKSSARFNCDNKTTITTRLGKITGEEGDSDYDENISFPEKKVCQAKSELEIDNLTVKLPSDNFKIIQRAEYISKEEELPISDSQINQVFGMSCAKRPSLIEPNNQRRGQGGALGAKPHQMRNLAPPKFDKVSP